MQAWLPRLAGRGVGKGSEHWGGHVVATGVAPVSNGAARKDSDLLRTGDQGFGGFFVGPGLPEAAVEVDLVVVGEGDALGAEETAHDVGVAEMPTA